MPTQFHPSRLLKGHPSSPYAILILNQPINGPALSAVLPAAKFLVCADAGANRLLDLEKRDPGFKSRLPDVVIGDLDSLSEDAQRYYRGKGVEIVRETEQESTDFMKALRWIRGNCKGVRNGFVHGETEQDTNYDVLDVIVLGGLGGRVDQGFSQIHHLYKAQQDDKLLKGRIYLLSEQSLTFVLDQGQNEMFVEEGVFTENIGIIPIKGPTRLSTEGLEWDVDDWLTEFGGSLSTSNHIRSDRMLVDVNGPRPLITFELAQQLCMTP